jgi:hypothetical protein
VQLGNGSTDGTTLQGNASRPKAMSYGAMKQEGDRWREENAALVTQASQQDTQDDAALGSRRGGCAARRVGASSKPLGPHRGA